MRSTQVMKIVMRSTQAIHAVYAGNEIEQLCGLRKQYMRSTQVKKLNNNAVYASNEIEQSCGLRKKNMRSTQVMKLIECMQNAMRCAKPRDAF